MAVPTNQIELEVADSSRMPWEILAVEQIGAEIPFKSLFADSDTGMQVMMLRYAAGFTNTWHTHPCAHGMYVLDGVLKTHKGEFGPGNFVWFPEGGWMEHGATEDNDVTFLFITNKPFAICYESDEEHPYPMIASTQVFRVIALLCKRSDVSRADLIEHYEHHHVRLILGLAPAPLTYRRNYTVHDDSGPDIITELGFVDRGVYEDWVATMYAPDSGVAADEETFLDRSRTVSYVVDEYVT